jgi:type I restriction enzyme S subunit
MKLRDLCELIVDCEHKTAPTQATGYPSIRTPNIGRGYFILDGVNRVSEETYRLWTRRAVPQPGDLIMAREAPVGNVAIIPPQLQPCLGQRTLLIRPDCSKVDPWFLNYFLNGPHVQGLIQAKTNGATVAHLNMEDVRTMELPELPPLPIQRRTGEILSAYDDLIENNTRRIKILEQMAQMLYREWFVNFHFPGHKKIKVEESEEGRVPEGWKTGILRDVCKSIDYGYTASAVKEAVGPRFLRITDIVPESIDWESVPFCAPPEKRIESYLLAEGDIVVARTGATTGYAKRLHKRHPVSIFASYLVRLKIGEEHSNAAFGLLVESDDYKRFIKANIGGAAQPQANAQVLTSIPVVIPPPKLQSDFSSIVEPLLDEKEILQLKNLNLRRTRDLLLPKLISGEIGIKGAQTETAVQVA